MKFLHLSDLHLGRSLLDYDLIEDQSYILDQIISLAVSRHVDAVLVAGDIYDRAIPSEAAVNLFDNFLCRLAKEDIAVFIISGNHDSDDRLNFGSSLFTSNRIYIASGYQGSLYHQTLEDSWGPVHFYLLPFVKASTVRHYLTETKIESYDQAVRAVIDRADIDPKERNVILSHQFVTGIQGQGPQLSGSEGNAVLNVGLVEEIGYDCYDPFDYVALGHIHSPQRVGRDQVRYSGSPLKYSLSESGSDKSVPLVTLGPKGQVDMEMIPLKPLRDLRHIRGTFSQLLDPDNITDTEDYIYVTLTDEEILQDAMSIFQQYYPRTVRIDYDNSHTRELDSIDLSDAGEERSFEDLIGDFYQKMYGTSISEEEMDLMRKVAGEAGVIHETD